MRALVAAIVVLLVAMASHAQPAKPEPRQFTFSWQFEDGDSLRPRGGTTRGAPLTLATEPGDARLFHVCPYSCISGRRPIYL